MIFDFKSKKGKREFNKLSDDVKARIIYEEVTSKINKIVGKEISNAFVMGTQYEKERIYKKYVTHIDESKGNVEIPEIIDDLLSELRKAHIMYVKNNNEEQGKE